MRITGTFLDEISHDIPHQNWGPAEWDKEFATMKATGIDTVILIRSGYGRWLTFASEFLIRQEGGYPPPIDLVELFLSLADRYGMIFYFGSYDSGKYWHRGEYQKELDLNLALMEEVWLKYGHHQSFGGWYLSQELSTNIPDGALELYRKLGQQCKALSNNLPVLISPYIDGVKAISVNSSALLRDHEVVSPAEHEYTWDRVLGAIRDSVDILAFQDGHCDFHELPAYLDINCRLAAKHGMQYWSNVETFDRDMPIKFLPIKWEKLRLKLKAAEAAGVEKVITFEYSHFMSPNSVYHAAKNLHARYCEEFNLKK